MQRKVITFDFQDGKGSVPAHRHTNPDGSIGGWVADTATVAKTAYVGENAEVSGSARVFDNARVSNNAKVYDRAWVFDNAEVFGGSQVYGNAWVFGNARIYGNAEVFGGSQVYDRAWVFGNARIYGNAQVSGNAWVSGHAEASGDAQVLGVSRLSSGSISGFSVSLNGPEILSPDFITSAFLRARRACEDQVLLFEQVFPTGAKPTKANLAKAKKNGLRIGWLERFATTTKRGETE